MFRILFTAVLVLTASLPAQALKLNKYMTHLTDGHRIDVVIADVRNRDKALLQVRGVNNDIDGIIFMADVVDEGREKTSYRIRFDGSKRYVIYKRKNHYTLYLPGEYDSEIHLSINKDGYREVDDLLMTYESQKSEGIQAQLAEYKRDDHLEYSVDKLEGKDEYVNEKCGTSLTTAVDWDAISNEQMMSMSIQGFCGQVADTMASLCQTDEAVKAAVSGITQVRCSIGDSLSISREENAIVFRTDKDTANQRDIISDFLRQL